MTTEQQTAVTGHWDTPEGAAIAAEYAAKERGDLAMGEMSDMALANAQYMVSRHDLNLLAFQTAAKERIRWLSARLASQADQGEGAAEAKKERIPVWDVREVDDCGHRGMKGYEVLLPDGTWTDVAAHNPEDAIATANLDWRAAHPPAEPVGLREESSVVSEPCCSADETDEDGNPVWYVEVQTIGGYSILATVWGGSPDEASSRGQLVSQALATQPSQKGEGA